MDAIYVGVVPLLVALISASAALYVGRPSKVASKAADIVKIAMDKLEQDNERISRELADEREKGAAHRAQCESMVGALTAEVVRLGGNAPPLEEWIRATTR